jgi:hypothetical protein
MRALGGNSCHPSTTDTINRIRTLSLCKNAHAIVSSTCPVELDSSDEDTFLSVSLIDQIQPDFADGQHASEDDSTDLELQPNEAQNYVAGYIAKKLCLQPSPEPDLKSWISVKGEGRLVEPSSELKDMVAKCDVLFDSFHGKGLRLGKNPLEKLNTLILKEYPHFPSRVVTLFCKVKFFSRIRALNTQMKLSAGNNSVRSLKQIGQFLN